MVAPKKRSKAPAILADDQSPSGLVAAEILGQYSDLTPSVRRILDAGLSEPARLHAITLFRDSLGVPGDPYRYPVAAIEAGRALEDVAAP